MGLGGVVLEEPFTRLLTGFLTSSLRVLAEVANYGAGFTVSNARVATPLDPNGTRLGVNTRRQTSCAARSDTNKKHKAM